MASWFEDARALLSAASGLPVHETNGLDWKLALSPDKKRLTEHICAFANHRGGGTFAFGVSDDGRVQGIAEGAARDILQRITNLGRDAVQDAVTVEHAWCEYPEGRVLLVHVRESRCKPVGVRGKPLTETFIRVNGTTRKATMDDIRTLIRDSESVSWEERAASRCMTDDELDGALDLPVLTRRMGLPPPDGLRGRLQLMEDEKLVRREPSGGYVLNLGAFLVARRLSDFDGVARGAVRVIRYPGISRGPADTDQQAQLGFVLGFESLLRHVVSLAGWRERFSGGLRVKESRFPEKALREILANALVHQDFEIAGAGPLVEVFDNRIVVSNPGLLLPGCDPDRLIGGPPRSRNPRLASMLRRCGVCEERGSGLVMACQAMEDGGHPPIHFSQEGHTFMVTLHEPRPFEEMSPAERVAACYQHALLLHRSGRFMTNSTLRERFRLPESQRQAVSIVIQQAMEERRVVSADPSSKSRKYAEYKPFWA